jgi:hypothetical protein
MKRSQFYSFFSQFLHDVGLKDTLTEDGQFYLGEARRIVLNMSFNELIFLKEKLQEPIWYDSKFHSSLTELLEFYNYQDSQIDVNLKKTLDLVNEQLDYYKNIPLLINDVILIFRNNRDKVFFELLKNLTPEEKVQLREVTDLSEINDSKILETLEAFILKRRKKLEDSVKNIPYDFIFPLLDRSIGIDEKVNNPVVYNFYLTFTFSN